MITAGRPRKPTSLKIIAGTARPDRINANEPQPARGRPPCPRDLKGEARRQWKHFADLLTDLRVLTIADGTALRSLAEAAADLAAARQALADRGGALTYENITAAGGVTIRPYPELKLIAEADKRLQGWLSRFGLSPVDRSKVSAAPPPPDTNPFSKFRHDGG